MSSKFDSHDLHLPYGMALIVEDDSNTAQYLQKVLEFWGCCAVIVDTVPDAIQIAARVRPELVICDLALPELESGSFATTLRQDPQLDGVRLVALSGDGDYQHRRAALSAGFDSFLAKPISLDEFFENLGNATPVESLLAVDETFSHVRRPVLVS